MIRYFSYLFLILCLTITATAPTHAAWAIAMGDGTNPIVARAYRAVSQADEHARQDCSKMAQNCKVVIHGSACVALANDGTHWGFGKISKRSAAKADAIASCIANHGGICKVVHQFCDE
jgi:hypothetical protein